MKQFVRRIVAYTLTMLLLITVMPMRALSFTETNNPSAVDTEAQVDAQDVDVMVDVDKVSSQNANSLLPLLAKAQDTTEPYGETYAGAWQYRVDEDGFAIITGYDDVEVERLSVPMELHGHAVTGIDNAAFKKNRALRQIDIHGNVLFIADNAFESITSNLAIRVYSGAYAANYAKKHGITVVERSVFEFQEGVIDLTDTISGHYERIGEGQYRFMAPESRRIQQGTYLCSPADNVAFRVDTIVKSGDAIIATVSAATAEEVLRRFRISADNVAPDASGITPANGVTMGRPSSGNATLVPRDASGTGGVSQSFTIAEKELANGVKFSAEVTMGVSLDIDIDIDLFKNQKLQKCKAVISISTGLLAKVEGEIESAKVPLARYPFPIVYGVSAIFEPNLVLKAKGSFKVEANYEGNIGFEWDKYAGKFRGICEAVNSDVKPSLNGSFGVYIAGDVKINIALFGDVIEAGPEIGIGVEGKIDLAKPECLDTDVFLQAKFMIKTKFLWMDTKNTLDLLNLKLFSLHWEGGILNYKLVNECKYDKLEKYKVTFSNGYSKDVTAMVYEGYPVARIADPTRHNYNFIGWTADPSTNTPWDFSTPITGEMTLYAIWEGKTLTVTLYDELQGTVKVYGTTGTMLSAVVSEEKYYENHRFDGWYANSWYSQRVDLANTALTQNRTLYAKWIYEEGYNPFYEAYERDGLRYEMTYDGRGYQVGAVNPTTIETVTIPGYFHGRPVIKIADNGFEDSKLKHIELPDTITEIGDAAFSHADLESVRLPSKLEIIGDDAFYMCDLRAIQLPGTLRVIGDSAFYFNFITGTLFIPKSVESIGEWAFAWCVGYGSNKNEIIFEDGGNPIIHPGAFKHSFWDKVAFGEGLTSIGSSAFSYCSSLQTVTLPSTLKSIGIRAFEGCGDLNNIKLPDGLMSVGTRAFWDCTSLEAISIPDSFVYDIWGYGMFEGCVKLKDVRLPRNCIAIPDRMFLGCTSLESIEIPDSVRIIEGSFNGCSSLKSINMPSALEEFSIDNCSSLKSLIMPNSVKDFHVSNCNALEEIVFPTVRFAEYDYARIYVKDCAMLQRAILPWYVSQDVWFSNCPELSYVEIEECIGNKISPAPLSNCPKGHLYIRQNTVGDIDFYLRKACDEAGIPYTCIGGTYNTRATSVTDSGIYSYEVLDDDTVAITGFVLNDAATDIEIPSTLDGRSVSTIRRFAFSDDRITGITIPKSINTIEDGAFSGATSIGYFSVANKHQYFCILDGSLCSIDGGRLICYPPKNSYGGLVIDEAVTHIADYAFGNASLLSRITLPSGLLSIGEFAFWNCSNLSTLTLPSTLQEIGAYAFMGIDELKLYGDVNGVAQAYAAANHISYNQYTLRFIQNGTVVSRFTLQAGNSIPETHIPVLSNMTFTGWYWDEACTQAIGISDVMPCADTDVYAGFSCDFLFTGDTELCITGYIGEAADVIVPSEIGGVHVTRIGNSAFIATSVKPITSLTIPDSIASIDEGAIVGVGKIVANQDSAAHRYCIANNIPFEEMRYRLTFEVNGGKPITAMLLHAGDTIELPSPIRDNYYFICWYSELDDEPWTSAREMPAQDLTLYADWVRRDGNIRDIAFSIEYTDAEQVVITAYSGNESTLVIPTSINGCTVTAIGNYAFANNTSLETVELPQSVTRIGTGAFMNSGIVNINGMTGVNEIGADAFRNCYALTSFTVPDNVDTLSRWMLGDCVNLKEIDLPEGMATIEAGAFANCTSLTSLYLPESLTVFDITSLNGCVRLQSVSVDANNAVYSSASGVLFNKSKTDLLRYPCGKLDSMYSLPDGVITVVENAFANCNKIQSVTIPQSVSVIGRGAFSNSPNLSSFVWDNGSSVNELPDSFVYGCTALKTMSIPSSVRSIGAYAFGNCPSLDAVFFTEDRVETISDDAFSNTSNVTLFGQPGTYVQTYAQAHGIPFSPIGGVSLITDIKVPGVVRLAVGESVEISASVAPLDATFTNSIIWINSNSNLLRVKWDDNLMKATLVGMNSGIATLTVIATDGSSKTGKCVVFIGDSTPAFTLPKDTVEIKAEAFMSTAIECMWGNEGLSIIGDKAFANAPSLIAVYLPETVSHIADDAFLNSDNLILLCHEGSYAWQYALAKGIPVVLMDNDE